MLVEDKYIMSTHRSFMQIFHHAVAESEKLLDVGGTHPPFSSTSHPLLVH